MKTRFGDRGLPKSITFRENFWQSFVVSTPYAALCALYDGCTHKWGSPERRFNYAPHPPKSQKVAYLVDNHPWHPYITIFKIGPKMTELWAIYVCPYMGMNPYFDLIMSTESPKYNIFW